MNATEEVHRLRRLQTEFGLSSTALDWVCSYVSNRQQYVKMGRHSSGLLDCCSGVPQGSVVIRRLCVAGGKRHREFRRTVSAIRR